MNGRQNGWAIKMLIAYLNVPDYEDLKDNKDYKSCKEAVWKANGDEKDIRDKY